MKPWRTAGGQIGGALLFSELITEQVEAKRALADSEVRFRATFENAAIGIAHLGSDLRWLRANEALCRILGWPIEELLTKSLRDISHPDDLAADLAHVELMRAGKIDSYDMDNRYLRKNGTIAWGRLTVGCDIISERWAASFRNGGRLRAESAASRIRRSICSSARLRAVMSRFISSA
jgi:PAS domain S-box-containing protein